MEPRVDRGLADAQYRSNLMSADIGRITQVHYSAQFIWQCFYVFPEYFAFGGDLSLFDRLRLKCLFDGCGVVA